VNPDPSTIPAVPTKKKSGRTAWLFAPVARGSRTLAALIFWQRIFAWVRSTKPELVVCAAVATWSGTALVRCLWRLGSLLRVRRPARRSEELLLQTLPRQLDLDFVDRRVRPTGSSRMITWHTGRQNALV
jgi:hypothetical protein